MSDTSILAEGEFLKLEQSWKSENLEFHLEPAVSESAWTGQFSPWALSSPWQTVDGNANWSFVIPDFWRAER